VKQAGQQPDEGDTLMLNRREHLAGVKPLVQHDDTAGDQYHLGQYPTEMPDGRTQQLRIVLLYYARGRGKVARDSKVVRNALGGSGAAAGESDRSQILRPHKGREHETDRSRLVTHYLLPQQRILRRWARR
jgi:hypothetical protein